MKDFFQRYSYNSVKLFLNQIAISMFGLVLALAAGMAKNEALRIITSVCAIVFYLFLEYTVAWSVGAQDHISVDIGKRKTNLFVPVKMWLLANSINLLLAVFITLGIFFPDVKVFNGLGSFGVTAALILEGMYTGLLTVDVAGAPLNSYWFTYFLITLPALIVIFFSYLLGIKNIKFTNMLVPSYPESDRPEKKKRK